jgi:homoserine dehydrogenase
MKVKRIGIIGLGTVGEAVLKSWKKYSSLIRRRTSLKIEIQGVCDTRKDKSKLAAAFSLPFTTDPYTLINDPQIDMIVELVGGIEPARTFILDSLKRGKNVVTANKALLAKCGSEIFSQAKEKNRAVGFEGSVCGAIPLIKSVSDGLVGCEVREIYGILNGTTNYILYKMRKERVDFQTALRQAQSKGLAEKKPDLDINGTDALHKLCILSYLCFGIFPPANKVYTEGIAGISLLDIIYTEELNYRIKLLAIAKKNKDTLDLRVHPTLISMEHPLTEVSLAYNAVYLDTRPAGDLLFYGPGAGGGPTSSSILADIVNLTSESRQFVRQKEEVSLQDIKDTKSQYYIRFMAHDSPGVLAKISKILASLNISIAFVTQKETQRGKFVPIVMILQEAKEDSVMKALARIDELSVIKRPSQVIRIEDF